MASFLCPCSGHQISMSGIRTGILSIFRTSLSVSRTSLSLFRTSLAIFRTSILWEIWCPEYGQWKLAISRTSKVDVRNMASKKCPYPGHQFLMSGIRTVKTGHFPDIVFWCPGNGQFSLVIFRTSTWPYSGHRGRAGYGTWSHIFLFCMGFLMHSLIPADKTDM